MLLLVAEDLHDLLRLVLAQQPGIDEDRHQLIADGAVEQRPRHRRIDAAAERQQHALAADALADGADRVLDEGRRRPFRLAVADVEDEVAQNLRALRRVLDLRVKLHAVQAALHVAHRRVRRIVRVRQRHEALRRALDAVAVRHPHVDLVGHAVEQRVVAVRVRDLREAEFLLLRPGDHAAERVGQRLHPVADAQHRQPALEDVAGHLRRAFLVDAVRSAGEDVALRLMHVDLFGVGVAREDLGVNALLAHAPGDQLGVLRAEVEDGDAAAAKIGGLSAED